MLENKRNLLEKIKDIYHRRGAFYVIRYGIEFCYYIFLKPKKNFFFQERKYRYFYHWYNTTWKNERAIEIPIFLDILQRNQGKKVLEIGNVLSHYFPVQHDVLDKYEEAKRVINQDVVDFKPVEKYDLIISISTLEHVGCWRTSREPKKILRAIKNLKNNCLQPGGQIIASMTLGYNPDFDNLIKSKELRFPRQYFFKKVSAHEWGEVNYEEVRDIKYNSPYISTNGMTISFIRD